MGQKLKAAAIVAVTALVGAAAAIWGDLRSEIDAQFAEAGIEIPCSCAKED